MREYVKRVAQMLPKMSQEQIRLVLDAITSENDMLDSILESLTTGLLVVDCSWKVLKFNKIAERYLSFGFFADETKVEALKLWEFVSEPEIAEFFKNCAESGSTNVSEEFTTTSPGGIVRFLSVSVFPFVSHAERKGNIIKIYDVTDKRAQEVHLRRMENMAGLTNLAAGMAHEIKNPLGAISIHIQLIQKALKRQRAGSGMLPEERFLEEHLDIVNEEIDVLNKTVTDFLFAVRPVRADISLVEPVKVLRNIVSFFAPEFNKSNVEFTLDAPQKASRLMIDEKLFREVVINIVQNAFAAVRERFEGQDLGACSGKIEINAAQECDKFIIRISDNGCGMSSDVVSRIFEPYFTTKAAGTGLGMTMVYKIIKEFSGDIQVESKLNGGTAFTIFLPVPQTETKLISDDGGAR